MNHTARQASLSFTNSQSSLKLMSIESVMPSSHLILCCPLLLLPPIPPSIRVFSNESTLRIEDYFIVKSKPQPRVIYFGKVFNSQWVKAKGVPLLTLSYLKTGTKIEPFSSLRTYLPEIHQSNFTFKVLKYVYIMCYIVNTMNINFDREFNN